MKSWKFAIVSASLVFAATSASARPARCRIVSNGEKPFNGVCDYMAESGGSFSLSRAKGHKFLEIDPAQRDRPFAGRCRGERPDQIGDQLPMGRSEAFDVRPRLLGRHGLQDLCLLDVACAPVAVDTAGANSRRHRGCAHHTRRPRYLTVISSADIAAKLSKTLLRFGSGAVTTTLASRLPIWPDGPRSMNLTGPEAFVKVRL